MRPLHYLPLTLLALAACMAPVRSQTKTGAKQKAVAAPEYAPKPQDSTLMRGNAFVERSEVLQGKLVLSGNLPTPCHELRVRVPESADATGTLAVEAYSVFDRRTICAQMLKPFTVEIPLGGAQAAATITINGKPVGVYDR